MAQKLLGFTGDMIRGQTLRISRATIPMTTRQIFEMISDELRVKEEARARGREHGKNKWNVNAMAKNNSSSDENSSQEGEIRSKVIRQTATKDTARSGVTQADQNKNTGLKTEPECKPSQSPAQTRHQSTHIAPASAPLRSFSNPVWNRAPTVAWPTPAYYSAPFGMAPQQFNSSAQWNQESRTSLPPFGKGKGKGKGKGVSFAPSIKGNSSKGASSSKGGKGNSSGNTFGKGKGLAQTQAIHQNSQGNSAEICQPCHNSQRRYDHSPLQCPVMYGRPEQQ